MNLKTIASFILTIISFIVFSLGFGLIIGGTYSFIQGWLILLEPESFFIVLTSIAYIILSFFMWKTGKRLVVSMVFSMKDIIKEYS